MTGLSITVSLHDETKQEIERILGMFGLTVEYAANPRFEEETFRSSKVVKLASIIDPQHFDSLAEQLQQNFDIPPDQDMFIFNMWHAIGHHELDLWAKKYDDPLMTRLENLEIDKLINEWAFEEYKKWKVKKAEGEKKSKGIVG